MPTYRLAAVLLGAFLMSMCAICGYAYRPPPLLTPREKPLALVRSDGKVYVFGGTNAEAGTFLELYDVRVGSQRLAAPTPFPYDCDAVLLSGNRVLRCFNTCSVYLPEADRWEQTSTPPFGTSLAWLPNGMLLKAGGSTMVYFPTFVIDPATLSAREVGQMLAGRDYGFPLLPLGTGKTLAAGGTSRVAGSGGPSVLQAAELFDPGTERWTPTAQMHHPRSGPSGLTLKDGRALIIDSTDAEIYDPLTDQWTLIAELSRPSTAAVTLLPDGQVLISGGKDRNGKVLAATSLFNPVTKAITSGEAMAMPRARHTVVVLPDGTVLAIGGITTDGAATASVETLQRTTKEPRLTATLNAGFYVATSEPAGIADSGMAGIEVTLAGPMDGGLYFGGSLPGGGKDVGFAGFYLPEAQTVKGSVDFQPIGSGTFEVTIRLLDVNKQPEAPAITGGRHIEFTQALPAGFHVIELQTNERSPPATYQFALNAAHLAGGAVAGGLLDPASSSAPGYVAFYLAERQDVTIRLYNENTYGSPRGAGEVILTLYDSTGKVIARSGPGTFP